MPYLRKLEHVDQGGKKIIAWQATVRLPNGRRRTESFPLKGQAREWGASEELRIRRGDWRDPRLSRITVDEWHARWKAARIVEPATEVSDRSGHKRITKRWDGELLPSIGRLEIQAWVKEMETAGVKPAAVRRTYNLFRTMISDAVTEGILHADPCRRITLPPAPPKPARFFTRDQVDAILGQMPEPHRTLTELMIWCGPRWGEAAGLRAKDVIWLRRRISIVGTLTQTGHWKEYPKNSASRGEVPLPAHVQDALSLLAAGRAADEQIFRTKRGDARLSAANWRKNRWYPAIEAAQKKHPKLEIPRHSPHACRHTAASWLVQDGVALYDVQRLLRHAKSESTQIYAHLAPDAYGVITDSWDRILTLQRRTSST